MTLPTPSQYWLAPNAITFVLNVNGNPNHMQVDTPSDACVQVYMPNVPEFDYDVNHSFRKWYIKSSNVCFSDAVNPDTGEVISTPKYVYLRIPRTQEQINADSLARDASGNPLSAPTDQQNAELCYPPEKIDIYGCTHTNEYSGTNVKTQVGSRQYLYVWLQGIISPSNGIRQIQQRVNFGTLSTDIFIMKEGECTKTPRFFKGTTDMFIQTEIDGRFISFQPTDIPSNIEYVTIWIPSPKFHEGKTIEVKILGVPNRLVGGLYINSSDVEYFEKNYDRTPYHTNLDYLFHPRNPDTATTNNIFAEGLQVWGRCSFSLTSVRMAHNEGDPLNDWVWVIDNVNIYSRYYANPYHPKIEDSIKGILAYGHESTSTPEGVSRQSKGWITRDGYQSGDPW